MNTSEKRSAHFGSIYSYHSLLTHSMKKRAKGYQLTEVLSQTKKSLSGYVNNMKVLTHKQ